MEKIARTADTIMNMDQTKCDYCGETHSTPNRDLAFSDEIDLITVPIKTNGKREYLDFCNEDCLREFLILRRGDDQNATLRKMNQVSCTVLNRNEIEISIPRPSLSTPDDEIFALYKKDIAEWIAEYPNRRILVQTRHSVVERKFVCGPFRCVHDPKKKAKK